MDGDCFDEADAEMWLSDGSISFKNRWENTLQKEIFITFKDDILNAIDRINPSMFLEIACGPGMGLAPVIFSKHPQLPCIASDASSLVIRSWRKFLEDNLKQHDISLAAFSIMDMPLKNDSIDMITSFIGVSSSRQGEEGEVKALKEIFRVLKNGGYLIAIENEWTDYDAIEEVFNLWGKPVWQGFVKQKTWQEKFLECGFKIEACEKTFFRHLRKDDNDLGKQAEKFGIKIGMKHTLFILQKSFI